MAVDYKLKRTSKLLDQALPYILIIAGLIGFIASFIITSEKFQLLQNPHYHPFCSLNPVISCGSVMISKQASVFGFTNSFIGLAAFPILITIGAALLAGARFKRWFWIGLELGTVFGIGFVHFLFFQSVYRIHALCPFCMVVWICTITTFVYVTLYNIRHDYIKLPQSLKPAARFAQKHHGDIVAAWLLIITALILHHFWYFFGKHL
jgi:uncharacterized membrane protein